MSSVSFTGHRPNKLPGGYNGCANHLTVPISEVLDEIGDVDIAYVGLALGLDQVAAEVCLSKGIRVVGCKPCRNHESKWPSSSQQKYKELCEQIKSLGGEIILVTDSDYNAYVMQRRNLYMVDNSDIVIACWNGSSGGTANCVKYAERKEKQIINIWDKLSNVK